MKYMLLIYSPESSWAPDEWKRCVETSMGICRELAAEGKFQSSSPLHPVATATTVRIREGKSLITTGPFTETVEQLGGYYIVDVSHLDEAISIASRLPAAKKGTVEIRPIMKLDGLPPENFAPESSSLKRFMFLCYDDEAAWSAAGPEAHLAAMQEAVALTHELHSQGRYLSAAPLHPSMTATSVRMRDGRKQITDGPFAETREVLGGYYLILAHDQPEAVAIATRHSGARVGSVEVRQLFEVPSLG